LLGPVAGVMDSEFIKQHAARCRSLAERDDRSLRGPPRTFRIPGSLLEALLPSNGTL
jgi:hypothetical protein